LSGISYALALLPFYALQTFENRDSLMREFVRSEAATNFIIKRVTSNGDNAAKRKKAAQAAIFFRKQSKNNLQKYR